jgi:putative aldouronate transport system permease protein
VNNSWLILPNGFWAQHAVMRTYFDTSPGAGGSARWTSARTRGFFFPDHRATSMPIIAVIAMFSGVWQWNAWFDAMLYITKSNLKPLQAYCRSCIMSAFSTTLRCPGRPACRCSSPRRGGAHGDARFYHP